MKKHEKLKRNYIRDIHLSFFYVQLNYQKDFEDVDCLFRKFLREIHLLSFIFEGLLY